MNPVEAFSDKIIELEQVRQALDIRTNQEVIEYPDTAQTLHEMEELVVLHPEIVEFYAGAIARYTGKSDAKLNEQQKQDARRKSVLRGRIEIMNDVGVLSKKKATEMLQGVETGELVVDEAKIFFRLFKQQIPADRMPQRGTPARAQKASTKTSGATSGKPRQARTIDLVIEPHGGIRVNGTFLRGLSEAQKLIVLSGLAKGEGFRDVEIYGSPEFAKLYKQGMTTEELKEQYKTEWADMQQSLIAQGIGRLLDPARKPREKKHYVVAHEVTDKRPRRAEEPRRHAPTLVAEQKPFYARQAVISTEQTTEADPTFEAATIEQARQVVLTIVAEKGEVKRADVAGTLSEKFDLTDPRLTQALVRLVYAAERTADQQSFAQTKKRGGKWFVRAAQTGTHSAQNDAEQDAERSLFGDYFRGTVDDFQRCYGAVRGMTDTAIFYERGTIQLEDADKELLAYFKHGGIKQAVSEKSVIDDLAQRDVELTKEQLRRSARRINALLGRQVFVSLQPAKRAAKGFRIQLVGSL